ncbi:16S rRNA (uracil(1498)-N(3))-methyltransferase [Kovacikia minuta CCNUW1]|uniref:16S rRNA (uracil(1498)-N(3))-methyltransferase n=1 Tax=Kovacikia minuta TaxID=2931930 RepID=UPI001CCED85F|nr:16S rRNA (uracil(1498)-N(3))-methyltransferase [Kovacikia minuta]UBF25858.1 16S rRNA (uracil(1498)-N(3))-methyltransferase [Kovacikia minuta CCNUW1]
MLQRLVIASHQFHPPFIALTTEQQHYLCQVLRLRQGDRFIALDGQGQSWLARLVPSDHSSMPEQAEILDTIAGKTELPLAVTLVIALPKGNGFDEVVRQATELGVACIVPVISDRTLLKPSPQKVERWRRIAQEATEQSERQIVPTILEPISFRDSLQNPSMDGDQSSRYLCVTRQQSPHLLHCLLDRKQWAMGKGQNPSGILLAIGPEGGWTDSEVEQAISAGYQPVSLGSRILRAVTAPVVALSLIAASWEREEGREQEG